MTAEPYWTAVKPDSLLAFAALITAVGGFTYPFVRDWWLRRGDRTQSADKKAESELERLDRVGREQFTRESEARQALERRIADLQSEADMRNARSMEDWAHWYRHGWLGAIQRFNSLVGLIGKVLSGAMPPERALEVLAEIKAGLPDVPPHVPLLRGAAERSPPEEC